MIISHKHKFIFVKTRKTAGSSIEKYLYNYLGPDDICTGSEADNTPRLNTAETNGHRSHEWISNNYLEEWKHYFKFAVDRNPWDKLVSAYYFYKQRKPKKVKAGFSAFVRDGTDLNDWDMYATDVIKVDCLINYDTLHNSFLDLPIPYNNELLKTFVKADTGRETNYTKMYTEETIQIVSNRYDNVIKHFGYTF
jgi:hypothetical protein|tara:strand:+ start:248 stop:829 length:582 start_codon:yes stop_codon:yes gene_type:complete